ncbi:MAG: SCO family protein, partial [Candidatus Eremiobacteraeota bacterium]|nr:SCO family protein [Candidatus Eremiobacteraeota bacterium]
MVGGDRVRVRARRRAAARGRPLRSLPRLRERAARRRTVPRSVSGCDLVRVARAPVPQQRRAGVLRGSSQRRVRFECRRGARGRVRAHLPGRPRLRSPQGAPVTNVRRIAAFLAGVAALGAVAVATRGRRAPSAPDFALVDQHGAPFVLSAQRGRAVVLFFGYTHCPDVCPATMAVEERAIRRLGARAADVEIAFVTVDPERDDARALGRYAATFGPNVVALRGDDRALARAWTGYHVY